MYRLLFLAWLFFCLALTVEGQPIYVTGQLKPWTTSTPDFARTDASTDTSVNYYGNLDFFSRPTLSGAPTSVTAATFPLWYGVFDSTPSVRPYTVGFQQTSTNNYQFARNPFYPQLDAANATNNYRWSLHFRIQTTGAVTGISLTSTDEVAVYSNGNILGQLPGYSTTARNAGPFTTSGASVLDFYVAHRSSSVTPQLTIQLSFAGTPTCNAVTESQLTPFDDFSPSRILTIGAATTAGTAAQPVVQIMHSSNLGAISGFYPDVKFRVTNGFSTYFKYNYTGTTTGIEGFAFVVQGFGFSALAAQGGAEKLGYNFPNNLAVEFDTNQDTPTSGYGTIGTFDPNGNHVEIHTSWSSANPPSPTTADTACNLCNGVQTSLGTTGSTLPALNSGSLEVYIEYVPGQMTIWVDPNLSSKTYGFRSSWVRQASFAHSDFMNLFSSNSGLAWMGFTSTSSTAASTNIYISNWKIWTTPVSATTTTQTPAYTTWQTDIARAAPAPTANIKLQLLDGCGSPVNTPYDSVVANLVGPGNPSTSITQNSDGTWNVWYYNTLVGQNTLGLKVNEQTIIANTTALTDVYNPVFIFPAPISTNNSYFTPSRDVLASRIWRATDNITVTVYAQDAYNNSNPMPGGNFKIFFSQQAQIAPSSQTGNTYTFQIGTNLAAQNIKISVWYNGADILGSPTDAFVVLSGMYPDPVNSAKTLTSEVTTYKSTTYYGLIQTVAGQTGKFTLQFRDQYDNPLTEPALVLASGVTTSMGCISFGVVDPRCTPNPSTLSVAAISGPLLEFAYSSNVASQYQINITLVKTAAAGNPSALLPSQPTPSIVPDTEYPNMTLATYGSFSSGTQSTFVIQARDMYGNNRTQPSTSAPFQVQLGTTGGLLVTCSNTGTATPVSNSVVANATCIYTQTGQYVVTITPLSKTTIGTIVLGTCGSVACQTAPFNLVVSSGPPYPPLDTITIGSTVVAGVVLPFQLTSVDAQSNVRPNNTDNSLYVISAKLADNSAGATIGNVVGVADGQYSSTFDATVTGTYSVVVKMLGQTIKNSPQTVVVTPSATDLGKSTVAGPGVNGGISLQPAYFTLTALDKFGNMNNGTSYIPDSFTTCSLSSGGTCTVNPVGAAGSGLYYVNYTVPNSGSNPTFTITITDSPASYPQTTKVLNLFSSASSAISYATIHKLQADVDCTVTLTAADTFPAGLVSNIWLRDRTDNNPGQCFAQASTAVSWILDFNSGPDPFVGSAALLSPGIFNVSFIGTKLGLYQLQVFNGGTQTQQSKSPGIFLTIVPGPLDPISCTVVGFPATLQAGTQGSFQVTLRDNQGNPLLSASGITLNSTMSGTITSTPFTTFNYVFTANSPLVTVQYTPTIASGSVNGGTMTISTLATGQPAGSPPEIAGQEFSVTVTPAAVNPKYTCFYQSDLALATTCPVTALVAQGTAGNVYTADLYPRDIYGNLIIDPTTTFTVTLDNNPGMTSSSSFVGNGHWQIQFTPTKVTSGGTLAAFVGTTQVAFATMTVNPAVLDPLHSWVTGLQVNYTAGQTVAFTLNGRDRFDNIVNNAVIDISATGPVNAKKGLGASDINAVLPVTGGAYLFNYVPTKASTTNVTNPIPYTLTWKSSGVVVQINATTDVVNGTNQFYVYPATPYAPATVLPFLVSTQIPAGSVATLVLQLRDQYLNLIRVGGATMGVSFYADEQPMCDLAGNVVTDPNLVSNFTGPFFNDSGDGTYIAQISQTKAGNYYASFTVNGQPIRICSQLTTLFTITPLVADGPHSLLVGQAIDNPGSSVAGTPISFSVILRDKYDNPVTPDPTYNITINGPGTPDPCPTTLPYLNGLQQNITDNQNGTYYVNFEATVAKTFALVVLVNGSQVSTTCRNLTIRPWYVASFTQTSGAATLYAAQPANVQIQGFDIFGNLVTGGAHYWSLLITRTTVDGLDDYIFRIRSAYGSDPTTQIAPYVAHWSGGYTAVTHLIQDPAYLTVAGPVADQDFNFTVLEATCAGRSASAPKLCADGTCAATWSSCPAPAGTIWCGDGTPSSGSCAQACPAGQTLCRNSFNPYCATRCPGGIVGTAPSWANFTCPGSGVPRRSAADCPTNGHVCPTGYLLCPDGHSCTALFSDCNTALATCPSGMSMCYTGQCVSNAFDCPTEVSCSNAADVVCPDGSCQASASACSAPLPCYAPNSKRCPDGSCRSAFADCPSGVTCQPGFAKCETGNCVQSVADCASYIQTCNETMTRCADGTCRPNTLLCASQVTCTGAQPVLCADGSCVASVGLCRQFEMCNNASEPYMCSNGLCATSAVDCPTVPTCTNEYPVLCADRTCKASAALCLSKVCSVNRPFYCVDGSCAASMMDCPAAAACTSGSPIRCTTGSCVPASNMCPQPVCAAGFVACANGGCAQTPSQCGTSMTCAFNFTRCADGACRMDCTGITRDPSSYCKPTTALDSFFCPTQEAGFGCAASSADCPTSVTCPSDRPVRCPDRSCAMSYEYCKAVPTYVTGIKSCPANTFSQEDGTCNPSTTCPMEFPVKCWDETCRLLAADCPPETKCAQDSNDPSQIRPYLCTDGSCARNVYECVPTTQCTGGTVKCPLSGNGIICADTVMDCPDMTNNSLGLECPDNKQRCKNGACSSTCRDADYTCPQYIPIRCENGKCVESSAECPSNSTKGCLPGMSRCPDGSCRQSCSGVSAPQCGGQQLCGDGTCRASCSGFSATGCPNGGIWCQDGTCSTVQQQCTNPGFQFKTTAANACPAWRPFQCPSGYCAISSSLCPVPAQGKVCQAGYPVLCADGTCQRTFAQCAVVQPCLGGYVRCNNSVCAQTAALCPPWSLCPAPQVMCANGLCAANNASCIDETTGCPMNLMKCLDGQCLTSCPNTTVNGAGCSGTQVRCYDGSCAAAGSCPLPSGGYNTADPASLPDAPVASGTNTVWGCPTSTPVRCVDGICRMYPADGSTDTNTCPSGTVVCPAERPNVCADGSCVALPAHCPSFLPCANTLLRCPNDMTCVSSLTDCFPLVCPSGSPTLCPDGSCRRSHRECGRKMGYECQAPTPFRCFDGTCANSPAVCQNGRTCPSGTFVCWDGSCQKNPSYSNSDMNTYLSLHCPPVPACPMNYGLRCWDGSCANTTAGCSAPVACASGQRCADGVCRQSCLLFNGCYGSTPLYCPGAIVQCKAASDTCPMLPEVCAVNCARDYQVSNQIVSVPVTAPVVVDVSLDDDNAPHTRLEIAAGSFGSSAMLTIWSRTFATANGYRVRYPDGTLIPKTPSQVLLSTPFMGTVNTASSTTFSLNISVLASMDRRIYFSAAQQASQKLLVPCNLIQAYSGLPEEGGVACLRNIVVNQTYMSVTQAQTSNCSHINYNGTIANVTQTNSALGQTTCVCINVTGPAGQNTVPLQQQVCLTILQRNALSGGSSGSTSFFQDPANLGVCIDPTTTNLTESSLTAQSTTDGCASSTDASVIQVQDICLAYLDIPNQQFVCIDDYGTRVGRPIWWSDSGLPASVGFGRLTGLRTNRFYALMNIPQPLPPAAPNTGESWWAKYGKIVLGVGISMFILLLILAYAISRLIRYRRKYIEEKEEAEELRTEAKELDEKHGGLGVYDDEVEMIANPLVVEMQQLQVQLDETNKMLETQKEMDERQMAQLDKERQRIKEEIDRVKAAIAAQKQKDAARVEDMPSTSPGTTTAVTSSGTKTSAPASERQDFGGSDAPRRKKKDL